MVTLLVLTTFSDFRPWHYFNKTHCRQDSGFGYIFQIKSASLVLNVTWNMEIFLFASGHWDYRKVLVQL